MITQWYELHLSVESLQEFYQRWFHRLPNLKIYTARLKLNLFEAEQLELQLSLPRIIILRPIVCPFAGFIVFI